MFMAQHRVYVGFIPKNITEADFRETFLQYGKVTEAYIHKELKRYSHASDSISHFYGFVTFEDPEVVTMLLERKYVPISGGTRNQKSFPNFRQMSLKESSTWSLLYFAFYFQNSLGKSGSKSKIALEKFRQRRD
jgi:RNA recognition motif-containing protein